MQSTVLFTLCSVFGLHLCSVVGIKLNVTALTYQDNLSVLQCWTLDSPFTVPSSGFVGASTVDLGALAGNATYIVQPAQSTGGLKHASKPQWSWFISGVGRIQINNSTDEAWVSGGRYGLVFADDVNTSNGHLTTFPSKDETVILGLPTAGGKVPEHQILHSGPCLPLDLYNI